MSVRIALFLNWTPASFPLDLKWQTDLGSSTYERPAYQDGLVLFPANGIFGSHWYGIEATTGQVVWSQRVKQYNFRRCLSSKYLVISGASSLITLQTQTGEVVWTKDSAEIGACSEEIGFFSGVPRDGIWAFDLSTGKELWTGTTPRKSFTGLVYNLEAGELIASQTVEPWHLYIVEPQTGVLRYSFEKAAYAPEEDGRGSMYLVDQGQLFVGGTVQDARTGQVLHKEEHYDGILPPTVTNDTIYISTSRTRGVVALDRKTFEVKWIYKSPQWLPHRFISPVEILDGVGYVISTDMSLRAFDLETGQELGYWQPGWFDLLQWSLQAPGTGFIVGRRDKSGLTTSEDTLFVSFGDGKLHAFGK